MRIFESIKNCAAYFWSCLPASKHDLKITEKNIMLTQTELAAALAELTNQVQKIGTETAGLESKITDLETAIASGGTVTPEVEAAMAALKTQVQVVDDLVPDAAPAPPDSGSAPTDPSSTGTPATETPAQ